eukprot:3603094-Amphidinium_carterae.1
MLGNGWEKPNNLLGLKFADRASLCGVWELIWCYGRSIYNSKRDKDAVAFVPILVGITRLQYKWKTLDTSLHVQRERADKTSGSAASIWDTIKIRMA